MSDEKHDPSPEKADHSSDDIKVVDDVEKINDFETSEYLVDNYAHDVGVKVLVFTCRSVLWH